MSDNWIQSIEINNFKGFNSFTSGDFSQINLIAGDNNVGKTSFMEACYLSHYAYRNDVVEFYLKFIEFSTHRNGVNLQYNFKNKQEDTEKLISDVGTQLMITRKNKNVSYQTSVNLNDYTYMYQINKLNNDKPISLNELSATHYSHHDLVQLLNIKIVNTRSHYSSSFITSTSSYPDFMFDYVISNLKTKFNQQTSKSKFDELNELINELFGYQQVDILQGIPIVFNNGKSFPLSELGQGMKSFIYIIGSLLLCSNQIIFIDEIENGIHYSKLDRLWEIILDVAIQNNTQVFATTHSKECIESYAKASIKSHNDKAGFIELGFNRENNIDSIVMNNEMFLRHMKMGNEVRGWYL